MPTQASVSASMPNPAVSAAKIHSAAWFIDLLALGSQLDDGEVRIDGLHGTPKRWGKAIKRKPGANLSTSISRGKVLRLKKR